MRVPDGLGHTFGSLIAYRLIDMSAEAVVPLLSIGTQALVGPGLTLVAAHAGTGKGWLVLWFSYIAAGDFMGDLVHLSREPVRVLIVDVENNPDEWAFRRQRIGAESREVWWAKSGPLFEPDKTGMKRTAVAGDILEAVKALGIGLVVIDSASRAVGGGYMDPETPALLGDWVADVADAGACVLAIAHVARAKGRDRNKVPESAIGTSLWEGVARSVVAVGREGAPVGGMLTLNMVVRKMNFAAYDEKVYQVMVDIQSGVITAIGAVVPIEHQGTLFDRCVRALRDKGEAMSTKEIADYINADKVSSVTQIMSRNPDTFYNERKKWHLNEWRT